MLNLVPKGELALTLFFFFPFIYSFIFFKFYSSEKISLRILGLFIIDRRGLNKKQKWLTSVELDSSLLRIWYFFFLWNKKKTVWREMIYRDRLLYFAALISERKLFLEWLLFFFLFLFWNGGGAKPNSSESKKKRKKKEVHDPTLDDLYQGL